MSRKEHVPIRMCMGCRKRRKKAEMLRFTRTLGEGILVLDKTNCAGRGLYVCPDVSCLRTLKKKWRVEPFEDHSKLQIEN